MRILILSFFTLITVPGCIVFSTVSETCSYSPGTVEDIYSYINKLRAQKQISRLMRDRDLERVSQKRSVYLSGLSELVHQDPDGSGPMQRLREQGITRTLVGENIAAVTGPVLSYVQSEWGESSDEYRNMVHPGMVRTGAAVHRADNKCVLVITFTN